MLDLEPRVQDQITRAAQVGLAAQNAAHHDGPVVPWKRLPAERRLQLMEASALCRTALFVGDRDVHRTCNERRILNVTHAFIGACTGYYKDCGLLP